MKKLLCALLVVLLSLSLLSFSLAEEEKPLIGILTSATTHSWVDAVGYYAQLKAEELELNYRLFVAGTADEMSAQIDELVRAGAKAIVLCPQFTGFEGAVERALKAGVIVYDFDVKLEVPDELSQNFYLLTGDNYGIGVANAEYIATRLNGQGSVLVMDAPTQGSVAKERLQGFTDTIALYPEIKVFTAVISDYTIEAGWNDMRKALTKSPVIDAVFAQDDEVSIGVLIAVVEAEREDVKVITGGGGYQGYFAIMLDADIALSSAAYLPSMAATCVENAARILNGEEVEHTIVEPTFIIDISNVLDYLDENSPY